MSISENPIKRFVPNPSKLVSEQRNTLRCTQPSFLIDLLRLLPPNPDFENLIFVRSGNSQPISKSFTLAGTLPKPYFFQKNSRRPGVSNCQNLWTRFWTHLNLSLKAHSIVVLVYIWCVYQTSDFSETVFGLCHLTVKPLRGEKFRALTHTMKMFLVHKSRTMWDRGSH